MAPLTSLKIALVAQGGATVKQEMESKSKTDAFVPDPTGHLVNLRTGLLPR